MDAGTITAISMAGVAIIGACGLILRQVYHCQSGCCESDCIKSQETAPILVSQPILNPVPSPNTIKKSPKVKRKQNEPIQ